MFTESGELNTQQWRQQWRWPALLGLTPLSHTFGVVEPVAFKKLQQQML
jgi:hypothetical protein